MGGHCGEKARTSLYYSRIPILVNTAMVKIALRPVLFF